MEIGQCDLLELYFKSSLEIRRHGLFFLVHYKSCRYILSYNYHITTSPYEMMITRKKQPNSWGCPIFSMMMMLFQERLFQEISDVLKTDDDVTVYDLDKLQYLDQVYKEVLRWTLILPFIARKATEDIKLSESYLREIATQWFDHRPLHIYIKIT